MTFDPSAAAGADSGIFGLPFTPEESKVVLIPVPWDATTSYRAGTSYGPRAILAASRQVDLFDREVGKPYESKIAMLVEDPELEAKNEEARRCAVPIIEVGGAIEGNAELEEKLARVNALSVEVNDHVESVARTWIEKGRIVGIIGGDHSSPLGAIKALAHREKELGILHIDAHADLREAYEGFRYSHASIMYNVLHEVPNVARIVQVGIRDFSEEEFRIIEESQGRVKTFFDADLARARLHGKLESKLDDIVRELPDRVYVSFDIDGLDPRLCPNTGTPVPGGLEFFEATLLLRLLVESGRTIVGFDLNEVAPGNDGDEWDANVGARMLYKLIGWSLKSEEDKSVSA